MDQCFVLIPKFCIDMNGAKKNKFVFNLPSNPSVGDVINFFNPNGMVTTIKGVHNIMGCDEDLVVDVECCVMLASGGNDWVVLR